MVSEGSAMSRKCPEADGDRAPQGTMTKVSAAEDGGALTGCR